jgi:hypothetical protein
MSAADICKAGLWDIRGPECCPVCGAVPNSDCAASSVLTQALNELRQAAMHIAQADAEPPPGVTYRQRCEEFQRIALVALIRAEGG